MSMIVTEPLRKYQIGMRRSEFGSYVYLRPQKLHQLLTTTFHALVAAEAAEFDVVILEHLDFQSLADQCDGQPNGIRTCPLNEKMETEFVEQPHDCEEI
ncbi:hypothetical protein ACQR1K_08240 [Bradyrhizobium sp. HKCCYLRH3095]|uniref:hypothetical protein n=1 Tax=Bradyrhizobium sp. HKCCYLRH3095 TaxID=3420765 RepID=UPI003EB6FAE5